MNREVNFFVKFPKKKLWGGGGGVRVDMNGEVKIL